MSMSELVWVAFIAALSLITSYRVKRLESRITELERRQKGARQ